MDRPRASMQDRDHSHTLLGHAPRDPFACADAQGKPAVDFSDVFGGPPTRFSGSGDAGVGDAGACAFVGGEEDAERSRRWSSSVVEKPAFTGVGSPAHQRHLGDDFFSDIFRGGESACPTPRRRDRELFSPFTPGSRVLSPARTLPPTGDPLSGVASSLPAHLSYSSRMAKSFDYSSFRFPTAYAAYKHEESIPDVYSIPSSPNICPPASPSRFARIKDYLRFDTHASPRQRSLSHKIPHGDRPLETITPSSEVTDETEEQPKKASTGSKAYSGSGHFHFSIYKWASKGATLVMPSNPKERAKSGSRLSGLSSQLVQPVDLPLDNENMPQGTQGFQSEIGDTILFDDVASAETDNMSLSKQVTEPLPATSDTTSVQCDFTDRSDDTGTGIKSGTGLPEEEGKPESKSVGHPISDNSERKGNGGTTRKAERKESLLSEYKTVVKDGDGTAKVKQKNRGNTILGCTDVSQGIHGAPAILEDKIIPGSAEGKVMNFVKKLNPEAAQKTSGTVESRSRRPKFKDEVKGRVGDRASTGVVAADQKDYGNYGEALSTPVATSPSSKKAEQKAFVKSSGVEKMDGFFPEISGTTASLSGSTLDSFDASFCNIEEAHFENIEECLEEELSQDQHEVTETDLHQVETEIKMSETRIQEWSKGKEGNIRSLLSTMQYVLWPGSGWKPVPLVDIIEGASVRRAYQKALLCLHPDKLQQKGAETHQKYIAEKVFDMLQNHVLHLWRGRRESLLRGGKEFTDASLFGASFLKSLQGGHCSFSKELGQN